MKRLEIIAKQIIQLEKKCQEEGPTSLYLKKMEEIIQNLSFEELLFIDEYIMKNNDLKE